MTDDLLTPLALQDLDEIWEYVAVESCAAADRVVAEILRVASRLTTFKQFGRAYDSPVPGIQRFPVVKYPYVIFFCGTGTELKVVRVLHSRREPSTADLTSNPDQAKPS